MQPGHATGTTAIYYSPIEKKMQEMNQGMYASYFDAVFRNNNPDSHQSWVDLPAELLEQIQEYKTQVVEFERRITGRSEKGYKKAKRIIGPLLENEHPQRHYVADPK